MTQAISKPRLQSLIKAREAEKKALAELEAAQRDVDQEAAAAARRAEQAMLQDQQNLRKVRNRELYRIGGIGSKTGLTGVEDHVLESLFLEARERLDIGEPPHLALAMLVEQAGLGDESREVIFGILLRGKEVLNGPARSDQFRQKGRQKLQELEVQRNCKPRQKPVQAGPVDRPPMMVRFKEPPSAELRKDLEQLSMTFYRDERAWRGPNEHATEVLAAIRVRKETHLVAYPADWRDD